MNCPNCKDPMVTARATQFGEDYWYCRSCKKELAEMVSLPTLEEPPAAKLVDDCILVLGDFHAGPGLALKDSDGNPILFMASNHEANDCLYVYDFYTGAIQRLVTSPKVDDELLKLWKAP